MGKKVFFSVSQLKIITAKHLLKEVGIDAHSIDKMDSAHGGLFGDIELYVDQIHEEKARSVLVEAEILAR